MGNERLANVYSRIEMLKYMEQTKTSCCLDKEYKLLLTHDGVPMMALKCVCVCVCICMYIYVCMYV